MCPLQAKGGGKVAINAAAKDKSDRFSKGKRPALRCPGSAALSSSPTRGARRPAPRPAPVAGEGRQVPSAGLPAGGSPVPGPVGTLSRPRAGEGQPVRDLFALLRACAAFGARSEPCHPLPPLGESRIRGRELLLRFRAQRGLDPHRGASSLRICNRETERTPEKDRLKGKERGEMASQTEFAEPHYSLW
nr:uncharacterized protein LOC129525997 [Gorilla gorilla gorilla]